MYLSSNLKHLRLSLDLKQDELGEILDLNRGVIGSYEVGKALPRLNVLKKIYDYFKENYPKLTWDLFLDKDLNEEEFVENHNKNTEHNIPNDTYNRNNENNSKINNEESLLKILDYLRPYKDIISKEHFNALIGNYLNKKGSS